MAKAESTNPPSLPPSFPESFPEPPGAWKPAVRLARRALAPVERRDRLLDRPGAELLGPDPVALYDSLLAREALR